VIHRSYLFAPGHNERLVSKVFDAGADAVILDLEDAVPAEYKDRARGLVAEAAAERPAVVRINPPGTADAQADLAAVAGHALALRVPKVESPEQVAWVVERAPHVPLICAIESAKGLLAASRIASTPGVANLSIGGVDLRRELGTGPGNLPALHARSVIVVASCAEGLDAPIDSVFADVSDLAGLREEAEFSRSLGFFGKNAIHPAQIDIIHEAFTPTADEVNWAREVLATFEASRGAATRLDTGEMIDTPIAARAHRVLALAEQLAERDSSRQSGP
jgi:citrate lyase subunit beta / citryl-CoA lyase